MVAIPTLKRWAGLALLLSLVPAGSCLHAGNTAKAAAAAGSAALVAWLCAQGPSHAVPPSAHEADLARAHGLFGPILDGDSFDEGAAILAAFPVTAHTLEDMEGLTCDGMRVQALDASHLVPSGFRFEVFNAALERHRTQAAAWAAEAAEQAKAHRESLEACRRAAAGPGGPGFASQADQKRMELESRVSESLAGFARRAHGVLSAHRDCTTRSRIVALEADLNQLATPFLALEREYTHNQVGRKIAELNLLLAQAQTDDLLRRRQACPRKEARARLRDLELAGTALREDIAASDRRSARILAATERAWTMIEDLKAIVTGKAGTPDAAAGPRAAAGFPDEDPRQPAR